MFSVMNIQFQHLGLTNYKIAGLSVSLLTAYAFHCELSSVSVIQLLELNVQGMLKLDQSDKIRENLLHEMEGNPQIFDNPRVDTNFASVSVVLSGDSIGESFSQAQGVELHSQSRRFATMGATVGKVVVQQDWIEFVEESPWFTVANEEAAWITNVDDVERNSNGIQKFIVVST